jgi:hypothetical protein
MFPNRPSKIFTIFSPLFCAILLAGCNLPFNIPATPTSLPTSTPLPVQATATAEIPSPTPQPTSTVTPAPLNVVFSTGATAAVKEGTLQPGQVQSYTVSAGQNQPMILILESSNNGLYLGVSEADGTKLLDPANKWTRWQWLLPKTEVYTIQIFGGTSSENYILTIKVAQLIHFASGSSSITLNGTTVNGYVFSYALYCNANQTMTAILNVPPSTAMLDIFGLATGLLLSPAANANNWTGILPSSEDYVIEVIPNNGQVVNYSLTISCQ